MQQREQYKKWHALNIRRRAPRCSCSLSDARSARSDRAIIATKRSFVTTRDQSMWNCCAYTCAMSPKSWLSASRLRMLKYVLLGSVQMEPLRFDAVPCRADACNVAMNKIAAGQRHAYIILNDFSAAVLMGQGRCSTGR